MNHPWLASISFTQHSPKKVLEPINVNVRDVRSNSEPVEPKSAPDESKSLFVDTTRVLKNMFYRPRAITSAEPDSKPSKSFIYI